MSDSGKAAEPAAFARVREICLAYPGVAETTSWGHPNFRAGGKTFVTLEMRQQRPAICFRLEPEHVRALLQEAQFFATPHGRGQWVSRYADGRPPWRLIRNLVDESYHLAVASKNRRGES